MRRPLSRELPDWTTYEGLERLRGADLASAPADRLRGEQTRIKIALGRILGEPPLIFVAPGVLGPNAFIEVEWLKDRLDRIARELSRRKAGTALRVVHRPTSKPDGNGRRAA